MPEQIEPEQTATSGLENYSQLQSQRLKGEQGTAGKRTIASVLVGGMAIFGGLTLANKLDVINLPDWLPGVENPEAEMAIDDTTRLVWKKIASLPEHRTTVSTKDLEFDYKDAMTGLLPASILGEYKGDAKVVGKVHAFVSFKDLAEGDIQVVKTQQNGSEAQSKTVAPKLSVILPRAKIFSVDLDNEKSDLDPNEGFLQKVINGSPVGLGLSVVGVDTHPDEKEIREAAVQNLKRVAREHGLLDLTEKEAAESVRQLIVNDVNSQGVTLTAEEIKVVFVDKKPNTGKKETYVGGLDDQAKERGEKLDKTRVNNSQLNQQTAGTPAKKQRSNR